MTPEEILPDELLERIRGRAAGYDRDNAFFQEDLEELVEAGYLKLFVPQTTAERDLALRRRHSASAGWQRLPPPPPWR
jgi:hypothetical protein